MLPFHAVLVTWPSRNGLLQNHARDACCSGYAVIGAGRFLDPRDIWSCRSANNIQQFGPLWARGGRALSCSARKLLPAFTGAKNLDQNSSLDQAHVYVCLEIGIFAGGIL